MKRTCQECGAEFETKRSNARFCNSKCKGKFNNRRAQRGAVVYDILMNMRYDREAAAKLGVDWNLLCRAGEAFHAEDQREGRKSYQSAHVVKDEYGAQFNARVGHTYGGGR